MIKYKHIISNIWLVLAVIFVLSSCGKKSLSPEIFGTWKSGEHKVTVRSEPENMKFEFTSDTVSATLIIKEDNTVEGNVGNANIENGTITTNWFLPVGMTGIAYTINCKLIGKIFESDPVGSKEVEFWLGTVEEMNDVGLRYTEGGAQFPMGDFDFTKQ